MGPITCIQRKTQESKLNQTSRTGALLQTRGCKQDVGHLNIVVINK